MIRAYLGLSFLLLTSAVVMPNALQVPTATLLIVLGFGGFLLFRPSIDSRTILLAGVSVCATVTYVSIGGFRGAPVIALQQALVVYVISPIAWALVFRIVFAATRSVQLGRHLALLALLSSSTVALFFVLYRYGGAHAVEFFNVQANVHVDGDWAGATLHVPASLLFLSAGFFASPGVVRSYALRGLVMISLASAVLASGRTASLVGLAIGVLVMLTRIALRRPSKFFAGVFTTLTVLIAASYALDMLLGVDVSAATIRHLSHLAEFGGAARVDQAQALLTGAADTALLGAGHGHGVSVVRSQAFPWRYELVPFALLYKLGILGLLAVLSPVFVAAAKASRSLFARRSSDMDVFFAAAFIASLAAAITNPYAEAFSLQWMYVAPMSYFLRPTHERADDRPWQVTRATFQGPANAAGTKRRPPNPPPRPDRTSNGHRQS